MTNRFKHIIKQSNQLLILGGILVLINIIANMRWGDFPLYGYLDLTEDKRYTLTQASQELLRDLDDVVTVRVFLDGDFPVDFKRLQRSTEEMLADFRMESGSGTFRRHAFLELRIKKEAKLRCR